MKTAQKVSYTVLYYDLRHDDVLDWKFVQEQYSEGDPITEKPAHFPGFTVKSLHLNGGSVVPLETDDDSYTWNVSEGDELIFYYSMDRYSSQPA